MGFVEGIGGKVPNLLEQGLCHALGHPPVHAALHLPGAILPLLAVDEDLLLPLQHIVLLFGHGPADNIRPAQRVARQLPENAHDLLLIDNTSKGYPQDGPELLIPIADFPCVPAVFQIGGDKLHGPGPVQGDDGNQILNAVCPGLNQQPGHAPGLELEHPAGAALCQHGKGL